MTTQKSGNPKRVIPKQQIEIVQVLEEKPYGKFGKTLIPVLAKNLSLTEGDPLVGKSIRHTIFNAELKDFIKKQSPGTRFLVDIEEVERPDSQYGPDRNIVQIYVNGEPVSKPSAKGGYPRGMSAEEIDMHYRIAALNAAVVLATSGKLVYEGASDDDLLMKETERFYALLTKQPIPPLKMSELRAQRKEPTKATENMPKNMPSQPQNQDSQKGQTEADQEFEQFGREKAEFANMGEFYAACLKQKGFNRTDTDKELKGKYDLSTPGGRQDAWVRIAGLPGKSKEG